MKRRSLKKLSFKKVTITNVSKQKGGMSRNSGHPVSCISGTIICKLK